MLTPAAALYQFFASAVTGWDAYPENAVPSKAAGYDHDATLPYLTYNIPYTSHGGEVAGSVNLWHKTTSEKSLNAAATELLDAIGYGGTKLPCQGGCLWIKQGTCIPMDSGDIHLKRRYINVYVVYDTTTRKEE